MNEFKEVERGDLTRRALIDAAIKVFARDGFHAASTRELANAADVNLALINYYFKGKQGLYLAAFEVITSQMKSEIALVDEKIRLCLERYDWSALDMNRRKEILLPVLLEMATAFLKLLTSDKTNDWAQLIMREQQQPTAAFEYVFSTLIRPLLAQIIKMIKILRNADEEEAAMISFSIFGLLVVWRVGRTGILRRMNWTAIGEEELQKVLPIMHRNITALVFA